MNTLDFELQFYVNFRYFLDLVIVVGRRRKKIKDFLVILFIIFHFIHDNANAWSFIYRFYKQAIFYVFHLFNSELILLIL